MYMNVKNLMDSFYYVFNLATKKSIWDQSAGLYKWEMESEIKNVILVIKSNNMVCDNHYTI